MPGDRSETGFWDRVPEDEDEHRPVDVERDETRAEWERRAAVLARTELRRYPTDDPEPAIAAIAGHVREIIRLVGEDPDRPGLRDTPMRVARAYAELLGGYALAPEDVMRTFPGEGYDEMVLVRGIPFASSCEHHMLPFSGVAHVGYVPGDRIVGLSKIPRLLYVYARRLQVQERLTGQVADALMAHLRPKGAICVIEAEHSCMSLRGAKVPRSVTVTSAVRGVFKDDEKTRQEALSLIGRGR